MMESNASGIILRSLIVALPCSVLSCLVVHGRSVDARKRREFVGRILSRSSMDTASARVAELRAPAERPAVPERGALVALAPIVQCEPYIASSACRR
jgi:hypothetical protein